MFGGYRFAVTGSSDKLVRLWSIEEVYKQAAEAAWGVHDTPHLTAADSAQSSHTAAVAEDGQEVSQGTTSAMSRSVSVTHSYAADRCSMALSICKPKQDVRHSRLSHTAGYHCLLERLHPF